MTRAFACGILTASVLAVHAVAQHQPSFTGSSDVVRVFATVTDRDGRLVTTLTRDQFEVRDEGRPQPITQFDNTPRPIRLVVMLDVSGSMAGTLPLLRGAADQLFARLRPDDLARVRIVRARDPHQPVVHTGGQRAARGASATDRAVCIHAALARHRPGA